VIIQAYICGPYTAPTEAERMLNIQKALDAASMLILRGYAPIVPHVAVGHNLAWESAMEQCRRLIQNLIPGRDLVVLIPGWERSRGSKQERELALRLGIRIVDFEYLVCKK